MAQPIEWYTTSALWDVALQDTQRTRFRQPGILRFASDTFMEDLEQMLATRPADLPDLVVRPETWRNPQAGWLAEDDSDRNTLVKLYQPSHGRFYLVVASLVCRQAGLPDKTVDTTSAETVAFVLRRLQPTDEAQPVVLDNPATYSEYGWYLRPQGNRWVACTSPGSVEREEERLPMFAMTYTHSNRKRRLRAGFLPVASRETYQAGPALNPLDIPDDQLAGDPLADQRMAQFDGSIGDTLTTLLSEVQKDEGGPTVETAREVLLFSLVDLATFFQDYLDQVWQHINQGHETWQGSDSQQAAVFERLVEATFNTLSTPNPSWVEAIKAAWQAKGDPLESDANADTDLVTDGMDKEDIAAAIQDLEVANLRSLIEEFGEENPLESPDTPADSVVPEVPKLDPAAGALYAVRCVYERPRCRGGKTSFVSELSQAFQLASFFDPDAPGRPIRIAMPVDTSTEGLRKFPRNVSFLISNQLRNQMERIEGIKLADLDEGNVNDEGGWTLGMICSLSIPIITICALILLLIIVFVLNIVFWWLPFFRICLPMILPSKRS